MSDACTAKRVAVSGSRHHPNPKAVEEMLARYFHLLTPGREVIVHGGAAGVDSIADKVAKQMGFECIVYRPDYGRYGRLAPLERNSLIVSDCNFLLAFPAKPFDGRGGTWDTIHKAARAGVRMRAYVGENLDPWAPV